MAILDQWGSPYIRKRFAHAASRNRFLGPVMNNSNRGVNELISMSDRRTICAISRELVFNSGLPLACIKQKANFSVGCAWLPTYEGSDAEAGEEATSWLSRVWFPLCDVQGGGSNWWEMLELISMSMDRDGEAFVLLTRNDAGFPKIQHIPGHQVWSKAEEKEVEEGPYRGLKIEDGVIVGPSGASVAFRVNEDAEGKVYEDISARSLIHVFERQFAEQRRGYPCFTHALNDMKNSMSSSELETIRMQLISSIFLVKKGNIAPDPDDPRNDVTVDTDNDTATITEGSVPGIHYVNNDADYETVKHENPGDVWESFQTRLWASAIVGADWVRSMVMRAQNQGTVERSEIMRCRGAISKRQKKLLFVATRIAQYAVASGPVGTPGNLLAFGFSMPARLSVDDGREARMMQEGVEKNLVALEDYLAYGGSTLNQHFAKGVRARVIATRVARESSGAGNNEGIEITADELLPGEAQPQPEPTEQ